MHVTIYAHMHMITFIYTVVHVYVFACGLCVGPSALHYEHLRSYRGVRVHIVEDRVRLASLVLVLVVVSEIRHQIAQHSAASHRERAAGHAGG